MLIYYIFKPGRSLTFSINSSFKLKFGQDEILRFHKMQFVNLSFFFSQQTRRLIVICMCIIMMWLVTIYNKLYH